ncbi:hypothetical protein AB0395_00225 [Streptosporangium sp. NPDC051023]|uniref:hypothetical protein n=1 Tax=Streptosporangium sp. NPDC051023 TaxID=3155410 RepID=UPI00344ED733
MSRVLTTMPAIALALTVLTGCGLAQDASGTSTPNADTASATGDPQAKRHRMEAIRADCMKSKGFKHIPYVPPLEKPSAQKAKMMNGDYAAMREEREKYGFDVFFAYVYPGDPRHVLKESQMTQDPNNKLHDSLSSTQQQARKVADDACYTAAFNEITGKRYTSRENRADQVDALRARARTRELDGDARLVELAAAFGDCLKGKGYPVPSLKPTAISTSGEDRFNAEFFKAIDELMAMKDEGTASSDELTPETARPYFVKERKAALDDLECGKDFYAAFLPKEQKIKAEVQRESGETDELQ